MRESLSLARISLSLSHTHTHTHTLTHSLTHSVCVYVSVFLCFCLSLACTLWPPVFGTLSFAPPTPTVFQNFQADYGARRSRWAAQTMHENPTNRIHTPASF